LLAVFVSMLSVAVFGNVATTNFDRPGVAIVLFNADFSRMIVVSPDVSAVVLPVFKLPEPIVLGVIGGAGGAGIIGGAGGGVVIQLAAVPFTPHTPGTAAADIALLSALPPPPPPHAASDTDEAKIASTDR
jgi:hypothetical protein